MWPTDAVVRPVLHRKMIAVLAPHLLSLSFKCVQKKSKDRFCSKWIRDRGDVIDAIHFQWDKYQRPRFIINFRSFDHPDDLLVCRQNYRAIDPTDFGFRIYMKPRSSGWFQPSFFGKLFSLENSLDKVVNTAAKRLTDVSEFLLGGTPSLLISDYPFWLDDRLPDNPPPWNSGPVGSNYHLPSRRAWSGNRLSAWHTYKEK